VLNVNTAIQRVTVTVELLETGKHRASLAQTRYDRLSSMVELSRVATNGSGVGNANGIRYSFAISTINFQTGVQP
jgi:hypothetical protein